MPPCRNQYHKSWHRAELSNQKRPSTPNRRTVQDSPFCGHSDCSARSQNHELAPCTFHMFASRPQGSDGQVESKDAQKEFLHSDSSPRSIRVTGSVPCIGGP